MSKISRTTSRTEARPDGLDRRGFFKTLGGASTVAAAAVVSPLLSTEAQAYDPGAEETKARYRETDHVKTFYRTNRY